jgi:CheY-like chemotaxis protein
MENHSAALVPKEKRERPLVLVVNDTQEILELFRDILIEEGYDVVLNSFAPRDLDTLLKVDPDLVILDFMMGNEGSGWQLLQKMKMSRETSAIPVVVCTGAVQMVRELEGHLSAKNVGVVIKPFDIDDLVRTIETAMRTGDTGTGAIPVTPRDPA